jgi:hypothetical protein
MAYKPFARIDMREANTCGVCAWFCPVQGTAGRSNKVIFYCDECGMRKAKMIGDMSGIDIHKLQRNAIADASSRIGEYLEKRIGKTDLAAMTEAQWLDFLEYVVREYRTSMHKLTDAPF